jgi:hypothetical protein
MTVSKRNMEDVDALLQLLPTLGVLGMSFQRLRCVGRGEVFANERLTSSELRTIAEKIEAAKRVVGNVFVDFKDPMRNLLSEEFQTRHAAFKDRAICGGCHAGVSYIYVCDDGTIQPCAFLRIKLGNIQTDDLAEVWESSEVLQRLRTRHSYPVCGECRFWHYVGLSADARDHEIPRAVALWNSTGASNRRINNRTVERKIKWLTHEMRGKRPCEKRQELQKNKTEKQLKEAGITVVDLDVKLQGSGVDAKTLQEANRNINFHLYKAKDRKTLERLEPPPIEEGIFVLHTGEYCAGTDVAYYKLRRGAEPTR